MVASAVIAQFRKWTLRALRHPVGAFGLSTGDIATLATMRLAGLPARLSPTRSTGGIGIA